MDTKELLKKVRKIEIKTRRLSDHIFGGEYHSTFKGRGMTFSEVRQYQNLVMMLGILTGTLQLDITNLSLRSLKRSVS
jgi:hypothetical protein